MKVAIQLHGQPRYVKESYEQGWKKLIDRYNADVYIHSWFDNTKVTEQFKHYGVDSVVSDEITKDTLKEIIDLYNPVSFRYDTPLDFQKIMHPYTNKNSRMDQALYGQYMSAYYADKLRSSSKYKYDVVLKSRIDLILVDFDIDVVEPNTIKIPYLFHGDSPMMNPALDHWAMGSPEVISRSCNIIHNLDDFLSAGLPAQSEFLVHLHLVKEKLKIQRVPHNYILTREYAKYGDRCFIPTNFPHVDHYDIFGNPERTDLLGGKL